MFYHLSSLLWKTLTTAKTEKLYDQLTGQGIIGDEQKGCRGFTRGIKNHKLIDEAVLKVCKKLKDQLSSKVDGLSEGI